MSATPSTQEAVRPLRALRYDLQRVALQDVVAPPYDVISDADRQRLAARSEHSVVHLILPESAGRAADLLHAWRRDGILVRDAEPGMWWHTQRFVGPDGAEAERSGFLSAVRLADYGEGRIRPHEQTHAHARAGRLELLEATRANLSPIFGLYDDPQGSPRAALEPFADGPPVMQVTDADGTVHSFWPVTEPDALAAVAEAMAEREILIADGHHRYETAVAYRDRRRAAEGAESPQPYDFMLMYLANLNGEGLAVYPTHRVVLGKRDVTPDLLAAFDVRELTGEPAQVAAELEAVPMDTVAFAVWHGEGKPALICTLRDKAAVMMAMPGQPAARRRIDAAVLETVVLAPMLGLLHHPEQFATTQDVAYVRDLGAACGMVDRGESAAAFLLRAPTVAQVLDVARAAAVMPQKSTYFFPKLYSGFLINPLDDE
jgi:uncharacterized protein (DUF1015 family)